MSATIATTSICFGDCGSVLRAGVVMCRPCREALMAAVRGAHDLLRELDVTLARQDAVTPPSEGRSAVIPLPYHAGASAAAAELRAAIRGLARGPLERTTVARFRQARERAWETVDIPDPCVFVGQCDCGTAVYARTGTSTVQCGCGRVWDAQRADGSSAFTRLAASMPRLRRWLLALGVARSRAQLYRDVRELTPVGSDDHGRVYRLADVWDEVTRAQMRRGA